MFAYRTHADCVDEQDRLVGSGIIAAPVAMLSRIFGRESSCGDGHLWTLIGRKQPPSQWSLDLIPSTS